MQDIPKPKQNLHNASDGLFSKPDQSKEAKPSWVTKQSDPSCLKDLDNGKRIMIGNAGDHALILQLLIQSRHKQLQEDFHSRLDDPSYEPADRLLLKKDNELFGHVQVSKQIAWFEEQRIPITFLQDFLTLPEYQADESNVSLLKMAESIGRDEGSIMGLVSTEDPAWFASQGWSSWHGQGYTRANVRSVLSHVDAPQLGKRRKNAPIEVRPWRHFELDSIKSLYEQISKNEWGALYRSETNWQWLVGRKAHDQLLIAVEQNPKKSKDKDELHENDLSSSPNVVGYAVIRDSCIVEMVTLPGHAKVRPLLVAQACRDAIDRDHHFISLHTPTADSMHELLVTAGGSWIEGTATPNETWMYKLLAPEKWAEKFYPVFHNRGRESDIARPFETVFSVGEKFHRFTLTRRSSRLEELQSPAENPINCDWQTFQDLLTSNLALSQAIEQDRIQSLDQANLNALEAIFPTKLFWQSPFPTLQL